MAGFCLRAITPEDVVPAGHVLFDAYREHNESVGVDVALDFSSAKVAISAIKGRLEAGSCDGIVAVESGAVVGTGFVIYGEDVHYLWFISVSPQSSNKGIGKAITLELLKKSSEKPVANSIRLVQAATNYRSFALYTRVGFRPVQHWSNLVGRVQLEQAEQAAHSLGISLAGYVVRQMKDCDVKRCAELFKKALGYDREACIRERLATTKVVTKDDAVVGYATGFIRSGYLIAEDEEAAVAMYANQGDPIQIYIIGQLYPRLLRWGFKAGLQLTRHGCVMVRGTYKPPESMVCSGNILI